MGGYDEEGIYHEDDDDVYGGHQLGGEQQDEGDTTDDLADFGARSMRLATGGGDASTRHRPSLRLSIVSGGGSSSATPRGAARSTNPAASIRSTSNPHGTSGGRRQTLSGSKPPPRRGVALMVDATVQASGDEDDVEVTQRYLLEQRRVIALHKALPRLVSILGTTAAHLALFIDGLDVTCRSCFVVPVRDAVAIYPCGHSFCARCVDERMTSMDPQTLEVRVVCAACDAVSFDGHCANDALDGVCRRFDLRQRSVIAPLEAVDELVRVLQSLALNDPSGELATFMAPPHL